MFGKKYIIDGLKFNGKREVCEYLNENYNTVKTRMRNGKSFTEALGIDDKRLSVEEEYDYYFLGKGYNSLFKIYTEYGVEGKGFLKRYKEYKDIGIALTYTLPLVDGRISRYSYNIGCGILILGYLSNDDYVCLNRDKVCVLGLSELQDLRHKAFLSNDRKYTVEIDGVVYNSFVKLCRSYGWSKPEDVIKKLIDNRYSLKEALLSKSVYIVDVTIEGVRYTSLKSISKKYGIYYGVIRDWFIKGEDLEARILDYLKPKYIVLGRGFNNLTEISEYFKVPENLVRARFNKGWSLEEVIGFRVRIPEKLVCNTVVSSNVTIVCRLCGDIFKCENKNKGVMYYSLEELQEIRKQAFLNGERF